MSKKVMIRNAAGILFEKWPETCPSCKKSLRLENVSLKENELEQFNVDPDDPALYAVMQIWDTKKTATTPGVSSTSSVASRGVTRTQCL